MSLQLELVHHYIRLQASEAQLRFMIDKCREALDTQQTRKEIEMRKTWDETYRNWFDKYPLDVKVPIRRISTYGRVIYQIDADKTYTLIIDTYGMGIEVTDGAASKCRVWIEYDGSHNGCVRDGCDGFDGLISNPKVIQYLISFHNEVYINMQRANEMLSNVRLE